jgi:hypothetical protein
MKILKAKKNYLNKQIFQISDLTYITRMTPLKELLNGEDMIEPIKVLTHEVSKNKRLGANGENFKEKQYSVWEGNQRVQAALQLGYTHIEGIIINE